MSTDLFAGRCRDCCNKRSPLQEVTDTRLAVPFAIGMYLCEKCTAKRIGEAGEDGTCMRPFGITATDENMEWVDLRPITFTSGDAQPITVNIKLLKPRDIRGDEITEIRFKFPSNAYWQSGGCLDFDVPGIARQPELSALLSVKGMLRQLFQHTPIKFT